MDHHVDVEVVHDPQGAHDHDGDDEHGKDQCHQIPALLGRGVHVQEVDQMDEDLHHRHADHSGQQGPVGGGAIHHHPERDRGQND